MERFGEYARVKREKQRISLRSLAGSLGLSAPYVSDIERGNRNPPERKTIVEWAKVIGEDPDMFARRAELDRRIVEVPVNYNPANTELAQMFARTIDGLTDTQRDQLKKIMEGKVNYE